MPESRQNILVVVGLSLLALGTGNAITGWSKMGEFRERKHAAIAAGGESVRLPFSGTPSILDPSTDAQLLYESAATKYEYYRVVLRGGLVFAAAGSLILVGVAFRYGRRRRAAGIETA